MKGFPTLKWFDGKTDQPIPYESKRDLESLQAFVSENLGVKPKAKKEAPSDIKAVTDADFAAIVLDPTKDVLVEFYAVSFLSNMEGEGASTDSRAIYSPGVATARASPQSMKRSPHNLKKINPS